MATDQLRLARSQLEEKHLAFPPVPGRLASRFRSFGPWSWGTRRVDPFGMYMFNAVAEWQQAMAVPRDYMALCHAGQGINSYALTYHLVYGPIGILFQVGWGGGYMDEAEQAARFRHQCDLAQGVVTVVDQLHRDWALEPAAIGLVEYSEFRAIARFQLLVDGAIETLPTSQSAVEVNSGGDRAYEEAHQWLASL